VAHEIGKLLKDFHAQCFPLVYGLFFCCVLYSGYLITTYLQLFKRFIF
jgi:hypothetical protein